MKPLIALVLEIFVTVAVLGLGTWLVIDGLNTFYDAKYNCLGGYYYNATTMHLSAVIPDPACDHGIYMFYGAIVLAVGVAMVLAIVGGGSAFRYRAWRIGAPGR